MIDETERRLARKIIDAGTRCQRLRDASAPQLEIDAADLDWIDAQEAYVAAGYSLEAFDAVR